MDRMIGYSGIGGEIVTRVPVSDMSARDKLNLMADLIRWAAPENDPEYIAAADVVLKTAGRLW